MCQLAVVGHSLCLPKSRTLNVDMLTPTSKRWQADLTIVPMEGWRRDLWHDQTGFPWITPSPNMPTLSTATVYPGQVPLFVLGQIDVLTISHFESDLRFING